MHSTIKLHNQDSAAMPLPVDHGPRLEIRQKETRQKGSWTREVPRYITTASVNYIYVPRR